MKTPPDPQIIAEAQALLALAMNTPSDVADVFVSYYSHTGSIDVSLHDYGWVPDSDASARWHAYADSESAQTELARIHREIAERLDRLRSTPKPQANAEKAEQLRKSAEVLLAQANTLSPRE